MLDHGVDCRKVESFGRILCGLADLVGAPADAQRVHGSGLSVLAGPPRDLDEAELPDPRLRPAELLPFLIREILERDEVRRPVADTAAWALTSLVRGIAFRAVELARAEGLEVVVAGGGGLADGWIRHVLTRHVESTGLRLFLNRSMPCGDAGIALGQVWSVVARQARAV
jgi:hydrogenase maturation protein HypF